MPGGLPPPGGFPPGIIGPPGFPGGLPAVEPPVQRERALPSTAIDTPQMFSGILSGNSAWLPEATDVLPWLACGGAGSA